MDLVVLNEGLEAIISLETKIPGDDWAKPFTELRVKARGTSKKAKAIVCSIEDTVGWDLTVLSLGQTYRFKGEEECKPGELLQIAWGMDVARGEMAAAATWLKKPKPKPKR